MRATVNGGRPAVRPFGAVMEHNGHLYFSTAKGKDVYSQLTECSEIQIAAMIPNSRQWVRINGKAVESDDLYEKHAMLEACPILIKHFGSKECAFFALFKIENMQAFLYDDSGKTEL